MITPDLVVGWREWVALPELGIPVIKAKVDTGARTSSLHADVLDSFDQGGERMVAFKVYADPLHRRSTVHVVAPVFDERDVRSSNGMVERRWFILTRLTIGTHRWSVELGLTSRQEMGFPMLIGRQALRRKALVNPGRSYLLRKPTIQGTVRAGKPTAKHATANVLDS